MQPVLPALPPIPATEVVTSNPELPQGASKQWHPVTSTALTTDLVPYELKVPYSTALDESLLLDTPVVEANIPDPWALAAGPQ